MDTFSLMTFYYYKNVPYIVRRICVQLLSFDIILIQMKMAQMVFKKDQDYLICVMEYHAHTIHTIHTLNSH